jgi:hypothetical protein
MDVSHHHQMDTLYREAVDLADQARAWFDGPGMAWRGGLPVDAQAIVAIKSLGITARLMAVMAWLLDPAHLTASAAAAPLALASDDNRESAAVAALAGTTGGIIAAASRRLAGRVTAMALPDQPSAEPVALPIEDGGIWRT